MASFLRLVILPVGQQRRALDPVDLIQTRPVIQCFDDRKLGRTEPTEFQRCKTVRTRARVTHIVE